MEADRNGVRMEAAKFTRARETDLTLAGGYAFNSRTAVGRTPHGLGQPGGGGSFRTDLQAAGTARLDATLRGPADDRS